MTHPNHEEVAKHLRSLGFQVAVGRQPMEFSGKSWVRHIAKNDDAGVKFVWITCSGNDPDLCDGLSIPHNSCPAQSHVHINASIRTGAGKNGKWKRDDHITILESLQRLSEYRGAPPERTQISRKEMPEPYKFKQSRFIVSGNQYIRTGVIAKAKLANVVGIQDNAKIDPAMASIPDEPVWFHFDCEGYAGATFDIITDGEIWYPINRKSHRITNQMKPKKSVDLSQMSVVDQEFLVAAISDFAQKV